MRRRRQEGLLNSAVRSPIYRVGGGRVTFASSSGVMANVVDVFLLLWEPSPFHHPPSVGDGNGSCGGKDIRRRTRGRRGKQ